MRMTKSTIATVFTFATFARAALLVCVLGIMGCHGKPKPPTLGNYLDKIGSMIDEKMAKASLDGQYLIEKSAREARMLLDNLDIIMADQRNKTIDRLSDENQKALAALDKVVDELTGMQDKILDLEDFVFLDIQNLMNRVPFTSDVYLMRQIKGYSQAFKPEGVYSITAIGNAFTPDRTVRIWVTGKEIADFNLQLRRANEVRFSVPVAQLNGKFQEANVVRAPVQIKSFDKKGHEIYSYSGQILLLPKYPINYALTETVATTQWSPNTIALENSITLPQSPGNEKWTAPYPLVVTIPKGCKMEKSGYWCRATYAPGTWDQVSGPTFSGENDGTATWVVQNQIHNRERVFIGHVLYRKPSPNEKTNALAFTETKTPFADRLGQGTYTVRFGDTYKTFDLDLRYFNGERHKLTPTKMDSPGVSGGLETKTDFYRLRIDVDLTKVF